MTPDKPGWWRLRTWWCGDDEDYAREFVVEVERHYDNDKLVYWLPHMDYTEPVTECRGEWLGPAILFDDVKFAELRRLRDHAAETGHWRAERGMTNGLFTERARAIEKCARLLGRALPEWRENGKSRESTRL